MVRLIDSDNPHTYDKFRKEDSGFHKKKYDLVLSLIKKNRQLKVLELGAGTGTYTRFLVKDFSNTTATDLRPEMIERLKKKKIKAMTFEANSLNLQFESESFDLVVGISLFHHIPMNKRIDFFKEANRVLKKGGFLVLTDPNKLNPLTSIYQMLQGEHAISRFEFAQFSKKSGFKVQRAGEILARTPGTSDFLDRVPLWNTAEKLIEKIGLGVTVFLVAKKKNSS